MRLEQARYEADLARRRFLAVEPENRLVARSLEREWNAKLAEVERLEREDAARPSSTARLVSPEERQRILALAHDLPAVWQAPTTTHAERKQLLRYLIKDVTLTKQADDHPRRHPLADRGLHDPGGPPPAPVRRRAPDRPGGRSAGSASWRRATPTARSPRASMTEGRAPGLKGTFTADKVQWLRYKHAIPSGCPEGPLACPTGQRGDGRCSARAAATALNVSVSTIAAWCQDGRLDGIQTVPHGPWWVRLTPAVIAALRKPARRHWARRASPDQGVC